MKSSLALALALGVSATALAVPGPGPVQQKGTPELTAKPLSTYGIEVPARSALRSLIPTGWRLFVHKSAELPTTISWKPGDQWTDVLGAASSSAGLSTLVDWESKTVFIRSLDVALEENAVRGEIAQAAVTPLPRFEAPENRSPASEKAERAPVIGEQPAQAAPTVTYDINTKPQVTAKETSPAEKEPQAQRAPALDAAVVASNEVAVVSPNSAPVLAEAASLAKALLAERAEAISRAESPKEDVSSKEKTLTVSESLAPEESIVARTSVATDTTPQSQSATGSDAQVSKEVEAPSVVAEKDSTPQPQERPSLYSISTAGEITAPNAMVALAAAVKEGAAPLEDGAERKHQDVAKDTSEQTRAALENLLAESRMKEADLRRKLNERKQPSAAEKVAALPAASTPLSTFTSLDKVTSSKEAEMRFFGAPSATTGNTHPSSAGETNTQAAAAEPVTKVPEIIGTAPVISGKAIPTPAMTRGPFAHDRAQTSVQAAAKSLEPISPAVPAPSIATASKSVPDSVKAPVIPQIPVLAVNPSAEQQKRTAEVVKLKPAPNRSSEDFTYTEPIALNKAPLRTVVQGIANRYGLRMVYIAPDIKMPGPVTLLSQSADQDLALLKKAMGLYAPVSLELTVTGDVLVESKDAAYVAAHRAKAAAAAKALSEARAQQEANDAKAASESRTKPAVEAPAAPSLVFTLQAGQALEDALRGFLTARGYTQEWKVAGGFDANKTLTYEGNTVAEVLAKVLVPLGISADIFTTDKHIVIRPGNYQE